MLNWGYPNTRFGKTTLKFLRFKWNHNSILAVRPFYDGKTLSKSMIKDWFKWKKQKSFLITILLQAAHIIICGMFSNWPATVYSSCLAFCPLHALVNYSQENNIQRSLTYLARFCGFAPLVEPTIFYNVNVGLRWIFFRQTRCTKLYYKNH